MITEAERKIAENIVDKMRHYTFITESGCAHVGPTDFATWKVMIEKALASHREAVVRKRDEEIDKHIHNAADFEEHLYSSRKIVDALRLRVETLEKALIAIRDKQPGEGGIPAVWCRKIAKQALQHEGGV